MLMFMCVVYVCLLSMSVCPLCLSVLCCLSVSIFSLPCRFIAINYMPICSLTSVSMLPVCSSDLWSLLFLVIGWLQNRCSNVFVVFPFPIHVYAVIEADQISHIQSRVDRRGLTNQANVHNPYVKKSFKTQRGKILAFITCLFFWLVVSPVSGYNVFVVVFLFFPQPLKYIIHVYAVIETDQISHIQSMVDRRGLTNQFIPLYVKKSFKTQRGRISIDPAILAAIGHRFIAKTNKWKYWRAGLRQRTWRPETRYFFWGGGGGVWVAGKGP